MSDGTIHAGVGQSLNFGWERKDIISFLEMMYDPSYTAKTFATLLVEECNHLYGGHPGDDTTCCVVKVRDRQQVNLMIGPPSDPEGHQQVYVPVLLQRGQAHRLRRHHLYHRLPVPEQAHGGRPETIWTRRSRLSPRSRAWTW